MLRQWTEDDVDALRDAVTASIEHLRPWMPWIAAEPQSRSQRRDLIRQWHSEWETGGDLIVGVFEPDGHVIGGSGLHRRRGPGALEIGYWIHVDHVRRGYATEVAAALTDLAFTVDGIDRVEIHHDAMNVPSGRVPRSLGFEFAGASECEPLAPAETGTDWTWVVHRACWAGRAGTAS